MPNRYLFVIITFILIIVITIFSGHKSQLSHTKIHAKNGIIDISSAIKQSRTLHLNGQWLFFYNQFLTNQEIQENIAQAKPINVPANWKLTQFEPQVSKTDGFGTYYLQITRGKHKQPLAISLPIIYSAYRLYIDDQLLVISGNAAQNKNDQVPRYKTRILQLDTEKEVIHLTLQVANFETDWGGIRYPITIGDAELIYQNDKMSAMKSIFLAAFLLAIALYNLILFSLRKTDSLPLIFALICFVLGGREFFIGNYIILNYLPELTFLQMDRVEHLTFFIAGPLIMHFNYLSFPAYFNKRFLISTYLIAILLSLVLLIYQNHFTVFIMQLLSLFYVVYALYVVVLACKAKQTGAGIILLASMILGGCVVNDILYARELIISSYLSSLGLAIYVLSQAYMTGVKFNLAFINNENLSKRLTRRNTILENLTLRFEAKVKERTAELADANQRLKKIAQTDPLTQVANRNGIQEIIQHEEARFKRSAKTYSIGILDLDHFKNINDKYGHDGGDEVLKNAANIIKQNIRGQDKVARWGGEEFIILLPETNLLGAAEVANKLRNMIQQTTIKMSGHDIHITATIGLAEAQYGESFDTTFKRADLALYKGKETGRNKVAI